MTRVGVVMQMYGIKVERRPFSIFTQHARERQANMEWRERAMAWGETHVDKYGHLPASAEEPAA